MTISAVDYLAEMHVARYTPWPMKASGSNIPTLGQTSVSGLAQIYWDHRDELLRFLTVRLANAVEAEDALQDLYLRIHALPDGPIGNGRAYLYRAAQNLALDKIRKRRRRIARDGDWLCQNHPAPPGSEPADDRADAETTLLERERAAALASAIAALPPGAGQVFRLAKIDNMPHGQIALLLGISRSGVEKHIALAMAHLRRSMAD